MADSTYNDLEFWLKVFCARFEIPKIKVADAPAMSERVRMIEEEVSELKVAVLDNDAEKVLDALVDIVYFTIGTSVLLDADFNEAFRRVHKANMRKVRAYTERSAVDLVKPPGWEPADLSGLI